MPRAKLSDAQAIESPQPGGRAKLSDAQPIDTPPPPSPEDAETQRLQQYDTLKNRPDLARTIAQGEGLVHSLRSGIDRLSTPQDDPDAGMVSNQSARFGAGVISNAQLVNHPVESAKGIATLLYPEDSGVLGFAERVGGPGVTAGIRLAKGLIHDPAYTLGNLAGGFLLPSGGSEAASVAGDAREAAMGSADASALKGLGVGPRSPKGLRTLGAVQGARPYLTGAKDLADLQSRIAPAKAEIWSPYNDALGAIGDRPIMGPDGMTTVRDLEGERAQLSALNRGLRTNNPEALQLAQQKGMSAAELLDRENRVRDLLDPHLQSTGIDPLAIRRTFGQVSELGNRIGGRTTLTEAVQPSGFGRMANLSLERPLQAPVNLFRGARDVIAGRPLWEAKPTDVAIREGFRGGGPKPNLGRVVTTGVAPPPGRLLPAPPREMPAPTYDGRVPDAQNPLFYRDTTPMRTGRLLPETTGTPYLPMSSYHEIFPEQLPNGRRITGGSR